MQSRTAGSAKGGVASSSAMPAPVASTGQMSPARLWFSYTILVVIAVLVILIGYRVVVPSEEKKHAQKVSAALLNCQQRIAGLAEYGGAEAPPYTKNYGKGDEFYFAWGRGSFHFQNGFGAKVPMSASCIGSVSTGQIEQLTLNGKTIQ
ncbi:hypothetical protein [Massilia sp. BHUDP2]|uniref:hypothetical protein n=1 Tax=Massilia sp. BHUDP2 TaxID=3034505 RepID=UPI003905AB11